MKKEMNIKSILFFLSASVSFVSCEPGYGFYIRNNKNSDLILKTRPSIESLYPEKSAYYDSILTYKVSEKQGLSIYRVKPYDSLRIHGNIGSMTSKDQIPFDYIEIIQDNDTVILNGKQEIFDKLKQEGKTRKYLISE
jgi:hypothetical protein